MIFEFFVFDGSNLAFFLAKWLRILDLVGAVKNPCPLDLVIDVYATMGILKVAKQKSNFSLLDD
jgi:hypothetical protein